MRIALCLSGQVRAIDANLHTIIENLVEPCGADVFCHFWDSGLGGRPRAEEAVSRLRPKDFQIDEQIDFGRYPGKGNIPRTRSMLYSLKQANSLKILNERRENFVYDFVIRTRTDLVIQKPFKPEEHNSEYMYARQRAIGKVVEAERIVNGEFMWCYREPAGALDGVGRYKFEDDMFFISNSRNMDLYASAYDSIEWLLHYAETHPKKHFQITWQHPVAGQLFTNEEGELHQTGPGIHFVGEDVLGYVQHKYLHDVRAFVTDIPAPIVLALKEKEVW